MKNRPLSVQIFMTFSLILVIIFLTVYMSIPTILGDFFEKDIYNNIEAAHRVRIKLIADRINTKNTAIIKSRFNLPDNAISDVQPDEARYVNHILVKKDTDFASIRQQVSSQIIDEFKNNAVSQKSLNKKYIYKDGDRLLYYIITKLPRRDDVFLVSFQWNDYSIELSRSLSSKLMLLLIPLISFAIIISLIFARKLSSSLKKLEHSVEEISNKNWELDIETDRGDEIGSLSRSINNMKNQLKEHDELQTSFLQTISHDLKTPLMVIRSYNQGMKDGTFSDSQSMDEAQSIIEKEALKMEAKVQRILLLNRLDYLKLESLDFEYKDIKPLIEETVNRLVYSKKNISFTIEVNSKILRLITEQVEILVENILDNQMRYAETSIIVKGYEENDKYYLSFFNDGHLIPEKNIDGIFSKFVTGKEGKFGLGLPICKKIMDNHSGMIKAVNRENGVEFIAEFNIPK